MVMKQKLNLYLYNKSKINIQTFVIAESPSLNTSNTNQDTNENVDSAGSSRLFNLDALSFDSAPSR